jgi:hypothetical protein
MTILFSHLGQVAIESAPYLGCIAKISFGPCALLKIISKNIFIEKITVNYLYIALQNIHDVRFCKRIFAMAQFGRNVDSVDCRRLACATLSSRFPHVGNDG